MRPGSPACSHRFPAAPFPVGELLEGRHAVAQHGEVVAVGAAQVQPDGHRVIGQAIADAGDWEALKLQPAVSV
jgi:hypothetical protein